MFDSGSSTGEIIGHSKVRDPTLYVIKLDHPPVGLQLKAVNAVSIRHQRPFRAVTASDDATMVFYHGMISTFFPAALSVKYHLRDPLQIQYSKIVRHFGPIALR